MPPPAGVIPNFINPPSRADQLITVNAVLLSITTIFVVLRFYTRVFIARAIGWDDYVCVLAMVCSYIHSALQLRMIHYGFGRHLWDVPFEKFVPQFPRYLVLGSTTHAILIFLVKLSILLLYLRLFQASKRMKITIYITGAFVLLCSIAGIAYGIIRSIPVFKSTDRGTFSKPNQSRDWFLTTWGILNIITDFLILVLPAPTVWGLNLSKRQRIALLGIFLTGTFTAIVSIIRLRVYTMVSQSSIMDLSWTLVPWGCWNVVEANVAIICACTACLKPFVKKFAPSFLSLTRTRGTGKDTADSGTSTTRTWPNKPLDSSYLELGNRQGNHEAYVEHEGNGASGRNAEYGTGIGIVKTVGVNIEEK
ncbi:MAG: hypothetical protein M1816_003415 [Peltula sp. TS41687]|nr:MAG: hypothetical protein M1816_003415 [Peltula sp. TS41687]